MRRNRVKEKIRQGKLAIGTYVDLADPTVVELIGLGGFDAAFIDMEHSSFDLGLVKEMVRACEIVDITSYIRVPGNNPATVLRVLEMGAQWVQIPHIGGKDDALAAVKAVRYAPLGERGAANSSRAARYGAVPVKEHRATSNSEIILSVMVEDQKAVDELEEIASIEGLDLIAVGPNDLSQALGVSGSQDPRLKETIEHIASTLKRLGKAKMTFPLDDPNYPLDIAGLKRLGVAYTNCKPHDVRRLLDSYTQQVKELQKQL
ncbi:MAG: siderophore biosynthesis protein SbnG [Chloroflexi bacterium]|nr:siderophore biosynthesis protein SbnG [Chloroflexota bacterium]